METKDKLQLKKDSNVMAEITAKYPIGQSFNISTGGEPFFRIMINGYEIMLSEQAISYIFEPYVAPVYVPDPEVKEEPKPTVKQKPERKVKNAGRKDKSKDRGSRKPSRRGK